jgi:hypothetical protein
MAGPQPGRGTGVTGSRDIEVRGGAGGLDARYDSLERVAATLADAAAALLGLAARGHVVLASPDLLASAPLSPVSFARAEAGVAAALDGRGGVAAAAAQLEATSAKVCLAVVRYRMSDRLDNFVRQTRRHVQGAAAVVALPLAAAAAVNHAPWIALAVVATDFDVEEFLVDHPGVVDEVLGSTPGLVSTLTTAALGAVAPVGDRVFRATTGETLLPSDLGELAGLAALLYPAARARVRRRGTDTRAVMTTPPRDVGSLLRPLIALDRETWHDRQGEVSVRTLSTVAANGHRRTSYIVDIPGTKNWQVDPRKRQYLNDLATNLTTLSGDRTARVDGLASALRSAGARSGDPVMLIGHSQGGMVAVQAADEWVRSGSFDVTHVLTAGSPIGGMQVAASVQVLSLENRRDVTLSLDAAENRDRSNRTTVEFDGKGHGLIANHDLTTTYLPAAEALASTPYAGDPSIRAWVEGAGAFLAGAEEQVEVRAELYDIRNEEPP